MHGLKVTSKIYDTGLLGLLAIGAGEGDTSIQTEPPTAVNIAKGIDAIIIAAIARGPETCKAVSRTEIKGARDLIGKKVGVPAGTGGEYFFFQYLKKNGIGLQDLKVQDVPAPELNVMLYKGEIDAAFFWEPFARKVMMMEKAPNKFRILATGKEYYNPFYLLTVRRKFAEENPEAVRNLLRALMESNAFIAQNKEKCVRVTRYVLRTSYEDAVAALEDYEIHPPELKQELLPALGGICQWLLEKGRIAKEPEWRKVIQPQYLRAVAPARANLRWE